MGDCACVRRPVCIGERRVPRRTVRAEGAEEEAGRRRLPRAGVAGEHDVQAALEEARVAAALHVRDLGVEFGQEGLEGSHPDELADLLLDLAALGEERLETFGLDAEIRLRQRQRRAQQPGQGHPLVAVRDRALDELGREVRVAQRDHVTRPPAQ